MVLDGVSNRTGLGGGLGRRHFVQSEVRDAPGKTETTHRDLSRPWCTPLPTDVLPDVTDGKGPSLLLRENVN